MSWHFSQALAAAFSEASFSDGELSALSKLTGTDGMCSSLVKTTEASIRSRSGTTSRHSTDWHGGDVLTWYLAGFPAKRIPKRLEAATLRMISGRRCGESWQRQLPGTFLPRTLHARRSTPPRMISTRWATKPAAFPFQRQTWVLTTFGTATGFLHTPTAKANYSAPSMQKWSGCREFVRVFGKPSPEAHEYLMAWPEGWSDLKPLATDKFRSWQRRHGACFSQDHL